MRLQDTLVVNEASPWIIRPGWILNPYLVLGAVWSPIQDFFFFSLNNQTHLSYSCQVSSCYKRLRLLISHQFKTIIPRCSAGWYLTLREVYFPSTDYPLHRWHQHPNRYCSTSMCAEIQRTQCEASPPVRASLCDDDASSDRRRPHTCHPDLY